MGTKAPSEDIAQSPRIVLRNYAGLSTALVDSIVETLKAWHKLKLVPLGRVKW